MAKRGRTLSRGSPAAATGAAKVDERLPLPRVNSGASVKGIGALNFSSTGTSQGGEGAISWQEKRAPSTSLVG